MHFGEYLLRRPIGPILSLNGPSDKVGALQILPEAAPACFSHYFLCKTVVVCNALFDSITTLNELF